MKIIVTQEHINAALADPDLRNNPTQCCPIARALKDTFKVKYVKADYRWLRIGNFPEDTLIFTRDTPLEAEEFMHKFDEEKTVLPFEFELDLEGVQI